jgi:hypothetical protein
VRRYTSDPDGFDYIPLEDTTLNALCQTVLDHGCSVNELCSDIDLKFAPGKPFASARAITSWAMPPRTFPMTSSCPPA